MMDGLSETEYIEALASVHEDDDDTRASLWDRYLTWSGQVDDDQVEWNDADIDRFLGAFLEESRQKRNLVRSARVACIAILQCRSRALRLH